MTSVSSPNSFLKINLGIQVNRTTSALPQTGDLTVFNVTGGKIVVTSLVGVVTTVVQTQANAIKVKSVPTVGTSKDISGTLDISAYEVGAIVSLDGTALTTALSGTNAGGALLQRGGGIIVPVGALKVNAAASSTGAMAWQLTYYPYDSGAAAVAA
jgi:hypothetical protein